MATVNPDVFQKFKKAKKLPTRQEADGHEIEVEVREDEEQSLKLQEIIDLLVAAGYFRARIKGLTPFDKVVGGMTWCIESCNVDVDVDLLFQENSTIGQKIALTEKIVGLLPKMKCPHRIEPHQIQGLDFIHIFPVIQWLVKRSMEFRQEQSEFVRSYAVNQYEKQFDTATKQSKLQAKILKNVNSVNEVYRPRRYYKNKNAPPPDLQTRVEVTLLEFGHRGNELQSTSHSEGENREHVLEKQKTQEQQILHLLNNLTISKEDTLNYEDLSEEDLQNVAKHYASLQLEFKDGGEKSRELKQISALEEQVKALSEKCTKLELEQNSLEEAVKTNSSKLLEIRLKQQEADKKLNELEQSETNDSANVREVEDLVILNDSLRAQETQFREHCKKELVRLQNLIEESKKEKTPTEKDEEVGNKEVVELSENVRKLRLQLARKNRTVAALERAIDDVPNRPELAQYQRRFLELYNQVSAKHKETKQYYTLYNTLEDTRLYMAKELSLLNSISDSYPEAMQSNSGKDEFLKQFQNIVEGVKSSKQKVERKLAEEKRNKDQMSSVLQVLVEQQRKYVMAVRQLSIEYKKHETLLSPKKP